jgi:predicted RNase H-like HicB family nuclease
MTSLRLCRIAVATTYCGPIESAEVFMLLKVHFEPSDEGGYTVYVPALPGCISEGDTLEEARTNIREAIDLYLEAVEEPSPSDGSLVEEIAV